MSKSIEQALDECLFFSVKKLDRVLNKMADDAFKKTGLAPTYGFILLILEEKNGISQKEIANMLHIAPSTITRFIEKLENKGLVETVPEGRMSLVYLTDEGKEAAIATHSSWDELHDAYGAILGGKESDQLAVTLGKIADQLKK